MRIDQEVARLYDRFGNRNPEDWARGLGIHLYERSDFHQLMGMFAVISDRPCIFLNGALREEERRMVLAHELGHALLHRGEAGLVDLAAFTLFSTSNRMEYEANVFAAHLLIEEAEVLRLAQEGADLPVMAHRLGVDINLLLIKLYEMWKKGFPIPAPDLPPADFLQYGRQERPSE